MAMSERQCISFCSDAFRAMRDGKHDIAQSSPLRPHSRETGTLHLGRVGGGEQSFDEAFSKENA